MQVVYYTTTDELWRILATRTDPAAPAVVLLPRGWGWLVVDQGHRKSCTTEKTATGPRLQV